ncbi:MAG: AraC family transcriptional regulator [Solirubrobacteraceae bacterium]|nr:AraC family transcriptional regulator [Solirubrobacteraceae bacterium]
MKRPFDADGLLGFLAPRCVPGVEEVEGRVYRRAVGGEALEIELLADGVRGDPVLARAVCDLDADPAAIDARLAAVPALAPLVRATPGIRVPGTADPTELAVRALLGQQISVAAARTLAGRLTARLGVPLARPRGAVTHAFPEPAALARLDPEELPMPRARGRALVGLAGALADGLPVERQALLGLRGIGPWTADYVALRTGDRDVLLHTDLGVRHALRALGVEELRPFAEACRPYGSYATLHLWRSLGAPAVASMA